LYDVARVSTETPQAPAKGQGAKIKKSARFCTSEL
jgi:hypothetical protein